MNKIILFGLMGILLSTACANKCVKESEKVNSVGKPILEALANYSRKNGIPKSFKDIKDFPYKLTPCSEKPNLDECKVLKNGYFFKKDNLYYAVDFNWVGLEKNPQGFGLIIIHKATNCGYEIYFNGKIEKNYLTPTCSLIGKCRDWGRQ